MPFKKGAPKRLLYVAIKKKKVVNLYYLCCSKYLEPRAQTGHAFFLKTAYATVLYDVLGCAKNPVRDLAALVVLEERGMPEAISDAGSAGREERTYVMLVINLFSI
jgi:hypothetical protein